LLAQSDRQDSQNVISRVLPYQLRQSCPSGKLANIGIVI
jgi:hypothetical protein